MDNNKIISDLCRFGDLLISLNKKTDSIKEALYNVLKIVGVDDSNDVTSPVSLEDSNNELSSAKLLLFSDPSLKTFVKNVLKKFPNIGDINKLSGYDKFSVARNDVLNELKPIYDVLTKTFEFQEIALELLLQYDNLANFKTKVNYELMENYLELFVNFIYIHILLKRIGKEKIPIIICCADAYQSINGIEEKSYKTNIEFLKTYQKFYSVILEKIEKISAKIVLAVIEMKDDIIQQINFSTELLQNNATLSLTPEMSGITTAQKTDEYLYMIRSIEKKIAFVVVTGIFCPYEAIKQNIFVDIFKSVVSFQLVLKITRDEVFVISDELDNIVKANSKAGKFKAAVSDSINSASTLALPFHKERRDYIMHQLKQTLCVFENQEYFGNKFQVILATLGIAKFEIFWYFTHYDRLYIENKKQNSKQPKKVVDVNMIELISLVHELCSGILQNDEILEKFFVQFIKDEVNCEDIKNIYTLLQTGNYLSDNIIKLFDEIFAIANDITTENIKNMNKEGKLITLHIDWIRIQLSNILPKSLVVENIEINKIYNVMEKLSYRIRMIMNINEFFEKLCGLKEIFYYRDNLLSILQECFDVKYYEQAKHVNICGILAEKFTSNVSPLWPNELKYLSSQSIKYAEEVYSTISQQAAIILHKIALQYIEYEKQALPERIITKLEENKNRINNKKQVLQFEKNNTIQQQVKPGIESLMKSEKPCEDELANNRWLLRNLVSSLSFTRSVVYNISFNPSSFLTEALAQTFREYLGYVSFKSNTYCPQMQNNNSEDSSLLNIKRPSELLSDIKTYINSLNIIDGWVNIGCTELMTKVLEEELDPERAKKFFENNVEKLISPNKKQVGLDMFRHGNTERININNQPILVTYSYWYSEFVSTRSSSVAISLSDKSLFNRPPLRPSSNYSAFPVEEYTSMRELIALSELVGSEGIKYINEKLIKNLIMLTSSIKNIIVENQENLRKINDCADDDTKMITAIKQIKLSSDVYDKVISFGFIYEFRLKLNAALTKVTQDNSFLIYDSVKNIHTHYKMNIYEFPEYLNFDNLANDYGMLFNVDCALREGLKDLCNLISDDAKIWTLLPSFFTTLIYYLCYQDNFGYNSSNNSIENNGQCIATTFNILSTIIIANISQMKIETITSCQQQFINMSALILMRLKCLNPTDKEYPKELDCSWYILNTLINNSEFLKSSKSSVNYAIIQLVNSKITKNRIDYLQELQQKASINSPIQQVNDEIID
ncbi:hypothetical protein BCR36DRAFT_415106 [Piromyces finnis]|uniref:Uncharacterized protein n=1 Tax=Piromyces finnis TaxID=1754191 RepID=A0A1Y1V0B4_9FUNG|nr:hypothetical protein BCR36DRAFT_415106 [Piromyces finnis]|eukprot:ORX44346.1 hypothetical protein BCR36DRAFT_415106 [Piromyces finnis]